MKILSLNFQLNLANYEGNPVQQLKLLVHQFELVIDLVIESLYQ